MTTTKAEELSDWLFAFASGKAESIMLCRAAAELRRLAAVEAERDDLKLALAHTVRLVQDWKQSACAMEAERDAMRLDYSRLLEKHNNLHANAARDRAERDALLAARTSARTSPVHRWTDADADAARLALELECFLTDMDMPMAVTSRWWDSAHDALALHRQRISDELREIECPPDPDAVDRALEAEALQDEAAAELRRLSAVEAERDALLETFAKVCARLDIDTEAARKQPGKPSDVLIGAIDAEQDALKVALECERMRVVACGVVACSDTPKSAAVARDMLPVYRSESCDDVARRVDECISLRAERDALRADAERSKSCQQAQ